MLKRAFATLAFITLLLALAMPTAGQQLVVQITSPEMGQEVRGMVPIIGSASVPSFQFYKVEFGVGANPGEWAVIGSLHEQPVINGQLEVWNTAVLPDGVYTLRLQGVKQDGNWEEFFVRNLVVANTRPTSTPTPEVTETPALEEPEPVQEEGTPAVAPTATPRVSPTPIVIAPTRAPAQGTPTPTLTAPEAESESPLDVKMWGQSAMYGGLAMGAVFVLVGIVFGIRRLL
ncbi:MAG: hypothetical protein GXY68_01275 [Chloroflexi bacterium]|jgi:hypothetical protein|nr:hypothetical protein [Chloroflexota bacterium]